jgi:hypothetical protein
MGGATDTLSTAHDKEKQTKSETHERTEQTIRRSTADRSSGRMPESDGMRIGAVPVKDSRHDNCTQRPRTRQTDDGQR